MRKIILLLIALAAIVSVQAKTVTPDIGDKLLIHQIVADTEMDSHAILFVQKEKLEINDVIVSSYDKVSDIFGHYVFKDVYRTNIEHNKYNYTIPPYSYIHTNNLKNNSYINIESNVAYRDKYESFNYIKQPLPIQLFNRAPMRLHELATLLT